MKPFSLGEHAFINLDHVISWDFTKTEISPELTQGDIYDIQLSLYTSDGNEYTLDDSRLILSFINALGGRDMNTVEYREESIEYFVRKANEYRQTVLKNDIEAERS